MSLPFSQQVTADATCRLLQAGSGFAAHIAVGSVLTGQVWGAVAGTAGTIAMEALGRASGCYNNPDDAPGFEKPNAPFEGCKKYTGLGKFRWYKNDGTVNDRFITTYQELLEVIYRPDAEGSQWTHALRYINTSGNEVTNVFRNGASQYDDFSTTAPYGSTYPADDGDTCEIPGPDPQYPDHQPGDPIAPPYEFYDPETQCAWKVTALDSYLNSAGEPVFYWRATSNNPSVCGGPYYWWGNGQEPNIPTFEDPRGPDVPPRPPTLPPGPGDDLKDRLDKIEELIEQLKECACPETPVIEGEYRTISFRAEQTSPYGNARLRKRFKYRSQSGLDLGAVIDHWKDFSFTAGAVIVWHSGSDLGSPKVWAATVDEGKRVIRHAGGEAGINPDQVGKWGVSGSNHARYGVPGTMKVDTTGGYYWITARDGEDGRPIVGRVRSDS